MPELPEVEVVRRGLARWVSGRTVADVQVLHPRSVRRHLAGGPDFADRLAGATLGEARRRGKYLWVPLDGTGHTLVGHLGMSGQLLVQDPATPDETHLRVRFRFTDGGRELRFVDQRTFGGLAVEDAEPGDPEVTPARSRTSPATRSTSGSTTRRSSPPCAPGAPPSSARCSTRP